MRCASPRRQWHFSFSSSFNSDYITVFFIRHMIYCLIWSLLRPQGNWSFLTVVSLSFDWRIYVLFFLSLPLYSIHCMIIRQYIERKKNEKRETSYIYSPLSLGVFMHHTAIFLSVFRWHLSLRNRFFGYKLFLPIHLSAHVPMFVFLIVRLSTDLCWKLFLFRQNKLHISAMGFLSLFPSLAFSLLKGKYFCFNWHTNERRKRIFRIDAL